VAWLLRFMTLPYGPRRRGPSDRLTEACASILLGPSATRDRVTVDIAQCEGNEGVARLERAYRLKIASHDVRERLRKARVRDIAKARAQGLINDAEAAQLEELERAIADAVAVDDFAPEELAPQILTLGDVRSTAMTQPSAAE
jgi:acyl-CoA dehydrogenase